MPVSSLDINWFSYHSSLNRASVAMANVIKINIKGFPNRGKPATKDFDGFEVTLKGESALF